jgi:Trypsin-like peptidase domain
MEQAVLSTDRAVMIRYTRNGEPRRGSGLRVGSHSVLTADHCADGEDHRVVVGGQEHRAAVEVRSNEALIDMAVLTVEGGLPELPWLGCARVDRMSVEDVTNCVALGFPWWKAGGKELAQVAGAIPTSEGMNPDSPVGTINALSMKITNQNIPDPRGNLNDPNSPWRGMSGAVVVYQSSLVLGVVRGHAGFEGTRSLILTPLEAIGGLPTEKATAFWTALGVKSAQDLLLLRPQPDPIFERLKSVLDLEARGLLYRDAAVQLQVEAVRSSWR